MVTRIVVVERATLSTTAMVYGKCCVFFIRRIGTGALLIRRQLAGVLDGVSAGQAL